ncbi:MAG: S-methyl-5'-thioadenosine phosphorylase [archaeon]
MVKIGIIGGSGMDDPNLLNSYEKVDVMTPYGHPSSSITQGTLNGVQVAILARHGNKHQITPTNVNNRANIWALKSIGCTHIIATTAVGSLKEEIAPGDLVLIDQFIDRTTKRHSTFHDKDKVVHLPLSEPFCNKLRNILFQTATELQIKTHPRGTVVTIEGPRFSTKAESHMFRMWGADIINMSSVPEAILAREIGLCYASVAMSTDYDCWRESTIPVTFEEILRVMKENSEKVKSLILTTIPKISHVDCECKSHLQ